LAAKVRTDTAVQRWPSGSGKPGLHPPRKSVTTMPDITIMATYSPRKYMPNFIPEYSGVVSADELRLAFRQVERQAVVLRKGRDEENHESQRLAEDVPREEVALAAAISLRLTVPIVMITLMRERLIAIS
jgi:hypothetical protein